MIRALWLFVIVALIAVAAVILADLKGSVVLQFEGREIRMYLSVAAVIVILLSILTITLYRVITTFVDAPGEFFRWRAMGRRRKGFAALTRGLVAVAAGDDEEARLQTKKAISLVGEPPLALLLAAQASQLEGDDETAQRYYTQMLQSKETEFLGLRGLYLAAVRRGDGPQAISIAERARVLRPKTRWALNALFDLNVARGAWSEAAAALDAQTRAKQLDLGLGRRRRAVLSAALAKDAERKSDAETALAHAQDALALAPAFAPAALIAAKHLAAQGKQWKAGSLIETAWAQEPHPDLARAYAALKPEESPQARAKRLAGLASTNPEHPESRILSAAASISVGRLDEARETLRPLVDRYPSARVCLLMADIEKGFGGDSMVAREWSLRAMRAPQDAYWTCSACARTHHEWSPTCSACGAFDTHAWLSGTRATVEAMTPVEAAQAYVDATDAGAALYRDVVKHDDMRPSLRAREGELPMRDVTPDDRIVFPPGAPDDPGPDGEDFSVGDDDGRRKRRGAW
ncbi:MAG: tetratricopeptide repeat protein [Alphaproteobacteria bacterium]|nr:tetratricopeptide repeat protein [Alphaproteobacteria bacterium]